MCCLHHRVLSHCYCLRLQLCVQERGMGGRGGRRGKGGPVAGWGRGRGRALGWHCALLRVLCSLRCASLLAHVCVCVCARARTHAGVWSRVRVHICSGVCTQHRVRKRQSKQRVRSRQSKRPTSAPLSSNTPYLSLIPQLCYNPHNTAEKITTQQAQGG